MLASVFANRTGGMEAFTLVIRTEIIAKLCSMHIGVTLLAEVAVAFIIIIIIIIIIVFFVVSVVLTR